MALGLRVEDLHELISQEPPKEQVGAEQFAPPLQVDRLAHHVEHVVFVVPRRAVE